MLCGRRRPHPWKAMEVASEMTKWVFKLYTFIERLIFILAKKNKFIYNSLTPSLPRLSNIHVQPFATHTHTITCTHTIIDTHAIFSVCGILEIEIIEIFLHTFVTHIQTNTHTHTHTHTNMHAYTLTHILFV